MKTRVILLVMLAMSIAATTTAEAGYGRARNDYCKAKVGAKGLKGPAYGAEMAKCRSSYPNYE